MKKLILKFSPILGQQYLRLRKVISAKTDAINSVNSKSLFRLRRTQER